jgi:hypothetical protein
LLTSCTLHCCWHYALTPHHLTGKRNGLGLINDGALVQEFLAGKEYVIDKVSRDGVHKLVAIWQYDKREINGASFVYFGMKLMSSNTRMGQRMVAYSSEVLDALEIRQGPSHMEVSKKEPEKQSQMVLPLACWMHVCQISNMLMIVYSCVLCVLFFLRQVMWSGDADTGDVCLVEVGSRCHGGEVSTRIID